MTTKTQDIKGMFKTPLAFSNRSRGGITFTFFIFILLLCSSALMYYYFMQTKALEKELAKLREVQDAQPTYYVSSDPRPTGSSELEQLASDTAPTSSQTEDTIPMSAEEASTTADTPTATDSLELAPVTSPSDTIPDESIKGTNPEPVSTPTLTPRPTAVVKTPVTSLYDIAPAQVTPKVRVRTPQRTTPEN